MENVMTWDVSPILFKIGPLTIRWYGLLFATGFYCGYRVLCRLYRNEGHDVDDVLSLLVHTFWGTLIGGRLGHCLLYEPGYYLPRPLEIFQVWKGGLASHGATIGILIAFAFYVRKYPQYTYSWVFDRLVVGVAAAAGFIRLGNLMNSEILGTPTTLPWGVVFARVDNVPRHPAMVYESILYFISFFILYRYVARRGANLRRGSSAGLFLLLIFGARFLVEFVKEEQAAFHWLPMNLGQLLSIPFLNVGWLLWQNGDRFYEEANRLIEKVTGRKREPSASVREVQSGSGRKPARAGKRKKTIVGK
jgi:phosphatidylglycerol---prolipoprotein diacylglyceryl transferase